MILRKCQYILLIFFCAFIYTTCEAHDKKTEITALFEAADSLQRLGIYSRSMGVCQSLQRIPEVENNIDLKIKLYSLLSINFLYMGYPDKAEEFAYAYLSIAKKNRMHMHVVWALNNLAIIYYQANDLEQAERFVLEAIDIVEKENDEDGMSVSYGHAAMIYCQKKYYNKGLQNAQKSYHLAKKNNNDIQRATAMCQIAENLVGLERYVEARINYLAAMNIFKRHKIIHSLAICYYELALVDLRVGQNEEAKKHLRKSFNLNQTLGDNMLVMKVYDQINEMLVVKDEQVKTHKVWLIVVWGFVIIMSITLWCKYKINRRLKATSEKLRVSNDVKNRLIALISHDLRSGMLSINMAAHMLDKNKEYSEFLIDELVKQSDAQGVLVENLLQWSKLQVTNDLKARIVRFNVFDAVNDVKEQMQFYANRKSIKLQLETQDDIFMVSDMIIIQVVLRNIISNSIKFSHRNTTILLSYKTREDGKLDITVKDEGVGMPQEIVDKLSKKTMLVHTAGTEQETGQGIGMALSFDMLELIGGTIEISSKQCEGSVFDIIV